MWLFGEEISYVMGCLLVSGCLEWNTSLVHTEYSTVYEVYFLIKTVHITVHIME